MTKIYSDGMNETEVHSLQIDLFTKSDPTKLKKDIKQALKRNFDDVTFTKTYMRLILKHIILLLGVIFMKKRSELNGKDKRSKELSPG